MWLYYLLLPGAWLVWHLVFRIQVYGRENLIRDRGFILAPNHISAIDPVFVIISRFWGRQMWVFAKKELFENKLCGWFIRQAGGIPVRGGKEDRVSVDRAIESCRQGHGLLIFPEGTRSKDGQLLKPKSGAFVVASAAEVDLIPCRIIYGSKDGKMHLFCRVRVCFGKPIPAADLAMGEKRNVEKLRASKERLTREWEDLYNTYHF